VGGLFADVRGAALGMGGDADEPADTGLQDVQGQGETFGGERGGVQERRGEAKWVLAVGG
jgi:hypothetical protein